MDSPTNQVHEQCWWMVDNKNYVSAHFFFLLLKCPNYCANPFSMHLFWKLYAMYECNMLNKCVFIKGNIFSDSEGVFRMTGQCPNRSTVLMHAVKQRFVFLWDPTYLHTHTHTQTYRPKHICMPAHTYWSSFCHRDKVTPISKPQLIYSGHGVKPTGKMTFDAPVPY